MMFGSAWDVALLVLVAVVAALLAAEVKGDYRAWLEARESGDPERSGARAVMLVASTLRLLLLFVVPSTVTLIDSQTWRLALGLGTVVVLVALAELRRWARRQLPSVAR